MNKTNTNKVLIACISIMILSIIGIIIFSLNKSEDEQNISKIEPKITSTIITDNTSSIIKVEKEITSQIIQDGLEKMGVLLCEKYYFTEVVSYSSVKEFLNIKVPFTETEYLASYDGVVTAGIDFRSVSVDKNDTTKVITVKIPSSQIQNIDIDTKSFKLYSEKSGFGNPVSISDFNLSLMQLEETAKDKAIEKGILDRSDENAKQMISSFISGLIDTTVYTIKFV